MTKPKKTAITNDKDDAKSFFSDIYAEQMLVTAMVNSPEYIPIVLKNITGPEVFMDEASRVSFEVIMDLYNDGAEIRPMSMFQRLRVHQKWAIVKAAHLSYSYNDMMPKGPAAMEEAAHGLLSAHRRYHAWKLNEQLFQMLKSDVSDEAINKQVEDTLAILTKSAAAKYEKTSAEAIKGALVKIDNNIQKYRSGKLTGVNTGSAKINKLTSGWQKDQVIVLAGRVAMGKTSAAIDFLVAAAEDGNPCGFISMEMGAEELQNRLIANKTNIPYQRMISGELSDEELIRIQNAGEEIAKLPIYYIDDVDVKDTARCSAVVAEWKRKYGIEFLIIDYIQYLETEAKHLNDTQRVTAVMKEIKSMNRRLEIPIMALAQLSRGTEGRGDPRPTLADLKDSGQIEQDASIVIGLFNPIYYQRSGKAIYDELESDETTKVEFDENAYLYYFLKFRNGKVTRVDRYANLATCRFSDYKHMNKQADAAGQISLDVSKPMLPLEQQAHDFARNKTINDLPIDGSFEEPPF